MPRTAPYRRLALCLMLPVLTSCATATPITPPSSSALVEQAVAKALADACIALKPDVLTEAEEASVPLLNYANREAASWRAFGCKL